MATPPKAVQLTDKCLGRRHPRACRLVGAFVRESPPLLRAALRRMLGVDRNHPLVPMLFLSSQRANASGAWADYLGNQLPQNVVTGSALGLGEAQARVSPMHPSY